MRKKLNVLIVCLTCVAACSDDDGGWRFAESAPDDVNHASPDLGPDSGLNPDPDPDPEPGCDAEALELGPSNLLPGNPQIAGRGLVATEVGMGAVQQGMVTLWHPELGSQFVDLDPGEWVIGSGGPTVLSYVNGAIASYYALNLSTGAAPFELSPGARPNLGYLFSLDGDVPRFVDDDGSVAFIADDRVLMWDTVEEFFVAEASPYTLEIGEGRIGWVEMTSNDGYRVTSWVFNSMDSMLTEEQPEYLEIIAEGMFWSTRSSLWWWPEGGEAEKIGEFCGPVAFDRHTRLAYYSCGDGDDPSDPAAEHQLLERSLDGRTAIVATTTHKPYGLSADEGIVVWAEYGPGATTGMEPGRLKGWARGMDEPQDLGSIGQGCLTCGAYWTPAEVLVRDGLLGFTYARTSEGFSVREEHVDIREITRVCR